LPNLARLSPEHREFAEIFLLCGGSLKESGRILGVSYPTIRSRLDDTMAALRALRGQAEHSRLWVLERLESGEITAKEAAQQLRMLSR
jgi:hypothetical protein